MRAMLRARVLLEATWTMPPLLVCYVVMPMMVEEVDDVLRTE
jgi:hypothetical protein